MIICDQSTPVPTSKRILIELITLDLDTPITKGSLLNLHCKSGSTLAKIIEIIEISKDNKIKKKSP